MNDKILWTLTLYKRTVPENHLNHSQKQFIFELRMCIFSYVYDTISILFLNNDVIKQFSHREFQNSTDYRPIKCMKRTSAYSIPYHGKE